MRELTEQIDKSILTPMPTAKPTVSVIIPTFNRAEMLREALLSITEQTVPVLDVAVVDDGSTDHTPDIVAEFISRGAPIIYLHGPHRDRLGEARNRGVSATRGEWVAFLDSDDLWLPTRVEQQLDRLRTMPEAGIAFCNVQRFDDRGDVGGPLLDPTKDYSGWVTGDLLLEPIALPSALMLRRDAFLELGGFSDRIINEDYELTLLLSVRYPACYVPAVLALMRIHEGSRSLGRQRQASLEYIRIIRRFLAAHPHLSPEVKAKGRRGLANVHYKLARLYGDEGKRDAARRHLRAAVRLRLSDRRFWALGFGLWIREWTGK